MRHDAERVTSSRLSPPQVGLHPYGTEGQSALRVGAEVLVGPALMSGLDCIKFRSVPHQSDRGVQP